MTRIALVVSDVDGTLLTKDKTLTEGAKAAVRRLREAGIAFTIVSSRPIIGMRFLIEPLGITLPVGAFNGSCIVDPQLNPIELHLIPPSAAQRSIDVLNQFGVDIWLFTRDLSGRLLDAGSTLNHPHVLPRLLPGLRANGTGRLGRLPPRRLVRPPTGGRLQY